MRKVVFLDAGPLGMVTHPRQNTPVVEWFKRLLAAGVMFVVPEIADYEVRRELLRANKRKGIQRLDQLKKTIGYAPITTRAVVKAAEFWAKARNEGYPTAHDHAIDADVILAAQADVFAQDGDDPVIATTNVGDLARFVDAQKWEDIG